VDLKSLENLRDHFADLQQAVAHQPYADQIAYKMNQDKPIDVREVLHYLAVFDCSSYDEKRLRAQGRNRASVCGAGR
jgi:hypothetical protein